MHCALWFKLVCSGGCLVVLALEAVFWDVDGTLADTEMDGHRPAFNAAFAEEGLPWIWDVPLYEQLLLIAGGRQRMAAYADQLGTPLDNAQLDRLRALKQKHYRQRCQEGAIALRPGVERLIEAFSEAGCSQWIVTSSGRSSVESLLIGLFGSSQHPFNGLITADDVRSAKPDPEPYLKALTISGCNPSSVLAIEDSQAGLEAATAAGLPCLLTPSPWEHELLARLDGEVPPAAAALLHLGETDRPARQLSGPPCPGGVVTLEYVNGLVQSSR